MGKIARWVGKLMPFLMRWHLHYGKLVQRTLVIAILVAIAVAIVRLSGQIHSFPWHFNALNLLAAMLVLVFGLLAWPFVWVWLVRVQTGQNDSLRATVSVFIYGNAAKYLPGSLWNYFARAYLGQRQGIAGYHLWTANALEFASALIAGLVLYSASLLFAHAHRPFLSPGLSALLTLGLLVVVSPPVLHVLLGSIFRLRTRPQANDNPEVRLRWLPFVGFLALSIITWTWIGIGFWLLITSVYPVQFSYLPEAVGLWSLAVAAGLAAIGIPQGLGIKEGLLVVGLSAVLPLPAAAAIAVLSRIWTTACDLLVLVLWWSIDRVCNLVGRHRLSTGTSSRPEGVDPPHYS